MLKISMRLERVESFVTNGEVGVLLKLAWDRWNLSQNHINYYVLLRKDAGNEVSNMKKMEISLGHTHTFNQIKYFKTFLMVIFNINIIRYYIRGRDKIYIIP